MMQIISHPNVNGPPVVTHNTTRSYTQLPAGSMSSADGFVGEPQSVEDGTTYAPGHAHSLGRASSAIFADTARQGTGANTLSAFSENPLSMAVHTEGHYSNQKNTIAQRPAIPQQINMHEIDTVAPGPIPIDVRGKSGLHTSQTSPPMGNSPPSVGAPSDVSAGFRASSATGHVPFEVGMRTAPSSAAGNLPVVHTSNNVPSEKKHTNAWDTNHPRPGNPTELSNLPEINTNAKDHSPSNGAHDSHIDLARALLMESDPSAPAANVDGSKKSGVHWDPRIPTKEVPVHPRRGLE